MFGSTIKFSSDEEPEVEEVALKEEAVEEAPVPKAKKPAGVTFTMYCTLKKVPGRHRPGMRAFTKIQRATFEEWERVFLHY